MAFFPVVDFEKIRERAKFGGLVFLPGRPFGNVFISPRDREQIIGEMLPDGCEDIFDSRGPFCVGSQQYYYLYDIILPFASCHRVPSNILEEWIQRPENRKRCLWLEDYFLLPRNQQEMVYSFDDLEIAMDDEDSLYGTNEEENIPTAPMIDDDL